MMLLCRSLSNGSLQDYTIDSHIFGYLFRSRLGVEVSVDQGSEGRYDIHYLSFFNYLNLVLL